MDRLTETERILMRGGDNFEYVGRAPKRATTVDMAIGAQIRAIRREKALNQWGLGRSLNCSTTTVFRMEHGRYRFCTSDISHIAEALGVPEETLHGGLDLAAREKHKGGRL